MPQIRAARPEEAEALSALALRSKSHWGYTVEQLATFRPELRISPEDVPAKRVHVAERSGSLVGFYSLAPTADGRIDLAHLFVDPSRLSQGIGRRLFEHACETARAAGYQTLVIESDPHAAGFYQALGARSEGEIPSRIPGRSLPWFTLALGSAAAPESLPPVLRLSAARGFGIFLLYLAMPIPMMLLLGVGFGLFRSLPGGAAPGVAATLESDAWIVIGYSAELLGGVGVIGLLLARYRGARSAPFRKAIGLERASADQIAFGFCCGAALGFVSLSQATSTGSGSPLAPAAALLTPLNGSPSLDQQLHVWFVLFASPLFEEFIFRGVVLACFAASWGIVPAAIATSALFVSIHSSAIAESVWSIPLLALLSLVGCYLRVRTASLIPAIGAHFSYNAVIIGVVHAALAYFPES